MAEDKRIPGQVIWLPEVDVPETVPAMDCPDAGKKISRVT